MFALSREQLAWWMKMFVVNEPMVEGYKKKPLPYDGQMMIINKYGKEIEKKRIKADEL